MDVRLRQIKRIDRRRGVVDGEGMDKPSDAGSSFSRWNAELTFQVLSVRKVGCSASCLKFGSRLLALMRMSAKSLAMTVSAACPANPVSLTTPASLMSSTHTSSVSVGRIGFAPRADGKPQHPDRQLLHRGKVRRTHSRVERVDDVAVIARRVARARGRAGGSGVFSISTESRPVQVLRCLPCRYAF